MLDGDISCVPNSPSTFGWIYWLSACPSYTYETVNICKGETYTFGTQNITTAGIYWDKHNMVSGCDSFVKLTLTVDSVITPIITANGNVLSTTIFANYQWLDANKNEINGATAQNYETETAGNYFVVVTNENGCSDTSEVYNHTPSNINEAVFFNTMKLYPNPATEIINIELPQLKGQTTLTISALDGRTMVIKNIVSPNTQLSIKDLPNGFYFIKISTEDGTAIRKIVKK